MSHFKRFLYFEYTLKWSRNIIIKVLSWCFKLTQFPWYQWIYTNFHQMISYARYLKFQKPPVHCIIQEAYYNHTTKDNDII